MLCILSACTSFQSFCSGRSTQGPLTDRTPHERACESQEACSVTEFCVCSTTRPVLLGRGVNSRSVWAMHCAHAMHPCTDSSSLRCMGMHANLAPFLAVQADRISSLSPCASPSPMPHRPCPPATRTWTDTRVRGLSRAHAIVPLHPCLSATPIHPSTDSTHCAKPPSYLTLRQLLPH